ncbi:probable cationic amino acid transporter [Corythoichthys intestinalis]|uniref:probable cationic amino acid transporter n=1 Tax=Corythoichthys intestinalis TaxID=161448 RepID=UPI0025A5B472|nr:probable cationic amino acid transporter [Corythoichthys intestinalis]XP_061810218.1 probable cationic amino acid transporter [Nerophis lumbriciformis]
MWRQASLADAWYGARSRLLRTKPAGARRERDPEAGLAKVLTALDLVSLGAGSCAGTGMYVVAGLVAKTVAGPGVVLSFAVAAAASVLSGVCYAELGVRVPETAGSAYAYSYVTVGEFAAFLIGWNLVLEYLIGTAAGASALSATFDSLANGSVSRYAAAHLGTLGGLGRGEVASPDPLAALIVLLVALIVALGARNSVTLNNVLNTVNAAVWAFVVLAGLFFVSAENWGIGGGGGFLPYGWSGVMQGAATCFYAFIGFDIIATTGEEAQDPAASIPYAIAASLAACLGAYVSVSAVLTLSVPYRRIDGSAPLMGMFAAHDFPLGEYTAAAGSVAGLSVSLLGSFFPMPRILYAMADDGLLFRWLSRVSERTRTPVAACALSGVSASVLALLVSLRDLIEMMSIGTLLAYTLVSVCVLLLRYRPDDPAEEDSADLDHSSVADSAEGKDEAPDFHEGPASLPERLLGARYRSLRARLGVPPPSARPTDRSARTAARCTLAFFALSFALWGAVILGPERDAGAAAVARGTTAALSAVGLAALLLTLLRQPQSGRRLAYAAPCVPFVPAAAILVNSYLMLKLAPLTWARFAVWCALGLLIYGCYGVWHSSLEVNARQEEARASSYRRFDDHLDDGDDSGYQNRTYERDDDDDDSGSQKSAYERNDAYDHDSGYQNRAYERNDAYDHDFGYQRGGGNRESDDCDNDQRGY